MVTFSIYARRVSDDVRGNNRGFASLLGSYISLDWLCYARRGHAAAESYRGMPSRTAVNVSRTLLLALKTFCASLVTFSVLTLYCPWQWGQHMTSNSNCLHSPISVQASMIISLVNFRTHCLKCMVQVHCNFNSEWMWV